jgi:hypothetical protein
VVSVDAHDLPGTGQFCQLNLLERYQGWLVERHGLMHMTFLTIWSTILTWTVSGLGETVWRDTCWCTGHFWQFGQLYLLERYQGWPRQWGEACFHTRVDARGIPDNFVSYTYLNGIKAGRDSVERHMMMHMTFLTILSAILTWTASRLNETVRRGMCWCMCWCTWHTGYRTILSTKLTWTVSGLAKTLWRDTCWFTCWCMLHSWQFCQLYLLERHQGWPRLWGKACVDAHVDACDIPDNFVSYSYLNGIKAGRDCEERHVLMHMLIHLTYRTIWPTVLTWTVSELAETVWRGMCWCTWHSWWFGDPP